MVCREPSWSSSTQLEPADIILTNQDHIAKGDRPSITNSESEPAEPTGVQPRDLFEWQNPVAGCLLATGRLQHDDPVSRPAGAIACPPKFPRFWARFKSR